jgi:hypothetical protein
LIVKLIHKAIEEPLAKVETMLSALSGNLSILRRLVAEKVPAERPLRISGPQRMATFIL